MRGNNLLGSFQGTSTLDAKYVKGYSAPFAHWLYFKKLA
jgi:hypothetical protein